MPTPLSLAQLQGLTGDAADAEYFRLQGIRNQGGWLTPDQMMFLTGDGTAGSGTSGTVDQPNQAYDWSQLGYNGPQTDNLPDGYSAPSAGLLQWIGDHGYTQGSTGGVGNEQNGILDASGNLVPGSQHSVASDDNAFWNAAMIAGAVMGGAAGGAFGGGAGAAGSAGAAAGNGAFLGEGVASGVGAWDAAAGLGAAGTGTLGAGGAALSEGSAPLSTMGQASIPAINSTAPALSSMGSMTPTLGQVGSAASVASAANQMGGDPYDAKFTQSGGPAPLGNMGGDAAVLPSMNINDPGFLDALKNGGQATWDWLKANPKLASTLLGGAAGLLGGSGGSSTTGGYSYNGAMPTISRGNWSASATPKYNTQPQQATGLLSLPKTGEQNSGLARYLGLLGG